MSNSIPTEDELAGAIELAAKLAIKKLIAEHPGRYYYLSLITTGEAHAPILAAWSHEALEEAVNKSPNKEEARWLLKWSYADSPLNCFGEEFFERVRGLFTMRPDVYSLDEKSRIIEYETRLRAMETAMSRLDHQGVFGIGRDRSHIVINVEVMPPDWTNTVRAKRLNPPEAIQAWLEEAAENE
jgi:hypothetical protein